MQRITEGMLNTMIERINEETGSPATPWTQSGKQNAANVGNYHLSAAYGGWQLHRMMNTSGGVNTPLGGGFGTKRETYEKLRAFLTGLQSAKSPAQV